MKLTLACTLGFEFEEKKFGLVLKAEVLSRKPAISGIFSYKLKFFLQVQILSFLHEATQGDHIKLLY